MLLASTVVPGQHVLGNVDNQTLVLNGGELSIENGNTVSLTGWLTSVLDVVPDPTFAGDLNLPVGSRPFDVAVSGGYAYVVDQASDDLKVIDVSDPENPTLLRDLDFTDSSNLPRAVAVSGNYAYIADRASEDLKIVDLGLDFTVQGEIGPAGLQGETGTDGASAYQIWRDAGNAGTEADFLASLVGATGPAGADGVDGATGPQGPAGGDDQTLSLDGTMLIIEGGNRVNLAPMIFQLISEFNDSMVLLPEKTATLNGTETLISPFYIAKDEVTKALWDEVRSWAAAEGYTDLAVGQAGSDSSDLDTHPVTYVSWFDVVKWCNAYSELQGLTPVYYKDANFQTVYKKGQPTTATVYANWDADGYRLPTEAEWERAAQGEINGLYPWGDTIDDSKAVYEEIYEATLPVGSKSPAGDSSDGLRDMAGNVFEWCWDFSWNLEIDNSSHYPSDVEDPRGVTAPNYYDRVIRGGSWQYPADACQVAIRDYSDPEYSDNNIGFRVCRSQ